MARLLTAAGALRVSSQRRGKGGGELQLYALGPGGGTSVIDLPTDAT
eukprot:gene21321-46877_t